MARRLERAGATFGNVVRAWLYLGGITQSERGTQRYGELNRARTDFFAEQQAAGRMAVQRGPFAFYPASTGIGTAGRGLTASCLALQTRRSDVRLQPLENPQQTSAFDYAARFSAKSPKFSRAMAVVIGDYVTTWISGTASIVNSESVHLGNIERQTEQTIDNIESLISRENFERHGVERAGAELQDLAKIRIYVKRPQDYEQCRAICQRRLGRLPMIFAQADICRPELLVEIEGVAFSRVHTTVNRSGGGA
jgi:enamine deaminase RidA (YjgF/YER057c/UK114 family)